MVEVGYIRLRLERERGIVCRAVLALHALAGRLRFPSVGYRRVRRSLQIDVIAAPGGSPDICPISLSRSASGSDGGTSFCGKKEPPMSYLQRLLNGFSRRAQPIAQFERMLDWKLLRGSHEFPGPDGGTCVNEAALVAAGYPYRAVYSVQDLPA